MSQQDHQINTELFSVGLGLERQYNCQEHSLDIPNLPDNDPKELCV